MIVTLITDIEFNSVCGKLINLKRGARVLIDFDTLIAYCDGVHFDIDRAEFEHFH